VEAMEVGKKKEVHSTILMIIGSVIIMLVLVLIFFLSPLSVIFFPSENAPTLALVVTEPPMLDATTGKYRVVVEALVTGNPEPEVLFNRNDGLGAVERHQALLLLDEDESFMLTAIAANKIGEAKAALEINSSVAVGERTEVIVAENRPDSNPGNTQDSSNNQVDNNIPEGNELEANINEPAGNDNNVGDAAEAPAEANNDDQGNNGENQGTEREYGNANITASPSLSGCILQDTEVKTGVIMVGDATNNKQIKGFLSCDISEYIRLNGFQIYEGELIITNIIKTGKPTEFASTMIIEYTNYGSTLVLPDFYSDRVHILGYDTASIGDNMGIMYHDGEDSFRRYFNPHRTRIQYMFTLNGTTDFDGVVDAFVFYPAKAELHFLYFYLE